MSEGYVRISRHDAVLVMELNNPEMLNALSEALIHDMIEALESVDVSASPVIVVTGKGRAFCAGGDVKAMARGDVGADYVRLANRLVLALARHDGVIIAAVNGLAYGGGFSLALASDIVFASSTAQFAMVHGELGLVPDMGAHFFLPRITGFNSAKILLWTGEVIDAQRAVTLGIVHRVVQDEQLMSETQDFAQRLAQRPRQALRLSKRILTRSLGMDLQELLDNEVLAQADCFSSLDYHNRLQALLTKRRAE